MKEIEKYLDYELEDGETAVGGIGFIGETVRDFLEVDEGEIEDITLEQLNEALIMCGIKPIKENKMLDKATETEYEIRVDFNSYMEEYDWDDTMALISEYMEVKDYSGYWHIEGRKMGWRNRSGFKYAQAELGIELIQAIIPDTDVTGVMDFYEDKIELKLSHHDSPMGEYYTIKPVSEKVYEKKKLL